MSQKKDDGGRGDLTDEQWLKVKPLLPPQKAHTGQPAHDHRRILNGILWLHRTGAPWRDIPERYGLPQHNYERGFTDGEPKGYGKGCGKI